MLGGRLRLSETNEAIFVHMNDANLVRYELSKQPVALSVSCEKVTCICNK